jgi:hypothetical protein
VLTQTRRFVRITQSEQTGEYNYIYVTYINADINHGVHLLTEYSKDLHNSLYSTRIATQSI